MYITRYAVLEAWYTLPRGKKTKGNNLDNENNVIIHPDTNRRNKVSERYFIIDLKYNIFLLWTEDWMEWNWFMLSCFYTLLDSTILLWYERECLDLIDIWSYRWVDLLPLRHYWYPVRQDWIYELDALIVADNFYCGVMVLGLVLI